MTLIVHRAPRADQLVDGLAGLLRDPLPDPFEQELVLVPARGVERWLSQRLSHRLGPGRGARGRRLRGRGVPLAGEPGRRGHRHPRGRPLVARRAGLAAALASSTRTPARTWCRALSQHLGHGEPGEEGELRRGRRYAVARRLARLFASYAVQRPTLLAEWEAGRDTDGAGGALDPDLTWQPELWRLLVAQVGAPSPHQRHRERARRAPDARPDDGRPARRGSRCSATPASRSTEVELLAALGRHRDVHLWLPHPSAALWDSLTDLARRRAAQRGRLARAGRPPAARLAGPRPARAAADSAAGRRRRSSAEAARSATRPTPCSAGCSTTSPPTPPSTRPPVRSGPRTTRVQVHACHGAGPPGRGAARGAARPARRRPHARAPRHPGDVPRHRGLRAAGRGRLRDG